MRLKSKRIINVVLIEPEIPNNTGNIGRTCVALNAKLHLVKPFGFDLSEKRLRRAGLDYWPDLQLTQHESLSEFLSILPSEDKKALFTTKAHKYHFEMSFCEGDKDIWLIFGKETKGLPEFLLQDYSQEICKIPMIGPTRSLNLANSVAVGLYEVFRQINF